jgi:vancomycin resistance protein YoaR
MLVKRRIPHTAIQVTAFFVGIGLTCLVVIITLCIGIIIQDKQTQGLIYPGIRLDNQPISGKSLGELSQKYSTLNKNLSATRIELWHDQQPVATFSGTQLHIKSNGPDLVIQASAIGRHKLWSTRTIQKLQQFLKLKKYTFTSVIEVDEKPLMRILDDLATKHDIDPRDALFKISAGKVTTFAPEKDGVKINKRQVLKELQSHLAALGTRSELLHTSKQIVIQSDIVKPKITLEQSNTQGIKEVIGEGKSNVGV